MSWQAFSSFLIGVAKGLFHEFKILLPSLAAIFQNARLFNLVPRMSLFALYSPLTKYFLGYVCRLMCPALIPVTKSHHSMAGSFHIDPSFTGYGKTGVRLLKIRRSGKYHGIKQIEVSTELKLNNYNDYLYGDNISVVPTDTQKNTVYALAKQHQVRVLSCVI